MKTLLVLIVLVALSGCARMSMGDGSPEATGPMPSASASADTQPTQSNAMRFASLLRSSVQFDYTMPESPQQLREEADLVAVGRIVDVTAGRPTGRALYATFTIEVDEAVAGAEELISDGVVHLELIANGESKVEEYAANLPTGRVLMFLAELTDVEGSGSTGAPPDAPIFSLQSPLGLILEDGELIIAAYEDLSLAPPAWSEHQSFDAFVGALR